ncbi:hypothetical protein CsatA_020454 [Cannabis sativa]
MAAFKLGLTIFLCLSSFSYSYRVLINTPQQQPPDFPSFTRTEGVYVDAHWGMMGLVPHSGLVASSGTGTGYGSGSGIGIGVGQGGNGGGNCGYGGCNGPYNCNPVTGEGCGPGVRNCGNGPCPPVSNEPPCRDTFPPLPPNPPYPPPPTNPPFNGPLPCPYNNCPPYTGGSYPNSPTHVGNDIGDHNHAPNTNPGTNPREVHNEPGNNVPNPPLVHKMPLNEAYVGSAQGWAAQDQQIRN